MHKANAQNANFSNSILVRVNFNSSNLYGANFEGANITRVSLQDAKYDIDAFDRAIGV